MYTKKQTIRRLILWATLVLAIFIGSAVAFAQQPSPEFDLSQVPTPVSPPLALVGGSIYQESCAPCHGAQGMGDGPTAPSLPGPATKFAQFDAVWERSPAQLFHTAKFGRIEKLMPPWGNRLNDDQIWQAVAFAWSLHTNEAAVNAGSELYTQSCAGCHGEQGAGDGPEASGTLPNFGDLGYAMARSQAEWQAGWQTAHAQIGADWTPEQQRNVLEYIRTFSYVPTWGAAYKPGVGVIQGKVIQGTPGGPAVAGLEATLEAYLNFTPVAAFTTTLSATGDFTFTQLAIDPNIAYLVSVGSAGIRYSSDVLSFAADQVTLQTEMAVYETSDDPTGVRINRLHWILDSQPGSVVVGEIFGFGNGSDHTFIGKPAEGGNGSLTIALQPPANAQEISFENGAIGERFQQVDDLIYDTTPVVPGENTRQIIMRYLLPNDGDTLQFEQKLLYPIDEISVLVGELPQLQVEIPGFTLASRETLQGQTYQLWRPENAMPERVSIKLTGLLKAGDIDPRAMQDSNGNPTVASTAVVVPLMEPWAPWVVASVLIIAISGILIWAWPARATRVAGRLTDLQQQRERLLKRIARLDDRHLLQEVNESAWQRQRAQLKAQLIQVAQELTEAEARQQSA